MSAVRARPKRSKKSTASTKNADAKSATMKGMDRDISSLQAKLLPPDGGPPCETTLLMLAEIAPDSQRPGFAADLGDLIDALRERKVDDDSIMAEIRESFRTAFCCDSREETTDR